MSDPQPIWLRPLPSNVKLPATASLPGGTYYITLILLLDETTKTATVETTNSPSVTTTNNITQTSYVNTTNTITTRTTVTTSACVYADESQILRVNETSKRFKRHSFEFEMTKEKEKFTIKSGSHYVGIDDGKLKLQKTAMEWDIYHDGDSYAIVDNASNTEWCYDIYSHPHLDARANATANTLWNQWVIKPK